MTKVALITIGLCLCLCTSVVPWFVRKATAAPVLLAVDKLSAPDEDDEYADDDSDSDGDFLPSENEREASRHPPREARPFGVVLGLGRFSPWDTTSVGVRYAWRPNREAFLHGGTGKYRAELRRSEINYHEDFRTSALRVGNRWYTSSTAPLFLQAGLDAVTWKGSIESKGSDSATPGALPGTDFGVHGLVAEGAVGFAGHWDNGFSIEYCLLGVGQTLLSRYTYDRDDAELQKVVEASIRAPVWYGLLNLSLGWFF